MLKTYLKRTPLGVKIIYSNLYQKIRHPDDYKKQLEEYNFYKNLIQSINYKNDLIFDVGANVGNKSNIFSKLANKVLAFEPSSTISSILKHRYKHSNVEVFNCALGSANTTSDFFEVEGNEYYSSLSKKHIETTVTERNVTNIDLIKNKEVIVEKIENFIKKYGIPIYIKIDVEGYEYEVIQGLETAVPLISFEANLPEFCQESVNCISYLSSISSDKYMFNFTTDNFFLREHFVKRNDAIKFLESTQLRYLEIYAQLID